MLEKVKRVVELLRASRLAFLKFIVSKNIVKRVVGLLRASRLPLRARFQVIHLAVKRCLISFDEFGINLGHCTIYLSGNDTQTDLSTFWSIFVEEIYATQYKDTLVLDIGAHKGYYGAYVLLNGANYVWSFEPERRNFEILKKTSQSVNLTEKKWMVMKSAIGSENGNATLYVSRHSWSHSFFPRKDLNIKGQEVVRVKSLASALIPLENVKNECASRIIVKMNVEGAACDIILGTGTNYLKIVDEIFIAFEEFSPCRWEEILLYLEKAGFTLKRAVRRDVFHLKRGQ